jgi:hypothetical protein
LGKEIEKTKISINKRSLISQMIDAGKVSISIKLIIYEEIIQIRKRINGEEA